MSVNKDTTFWGRSVWSFSKIDISKLCYGFVLGVKTWPSWAIFPQVFWQYCHSFPGILYKEVRKRGHHLLMPKMTWLEASHLRLDFLLRFLSPNTFNNHSKNFFHTSMMPVLGYRWGFDMSSLPGSPAFWCSLSPLHCLLLAAWPCRCHRWSCMPAVTDAMLQAQGTTVSISLSFGLIQISSQFLQGKKSFFGHIFPISFSGRGFFW